MWRTLFLTGLLLTSAPALAQSDKPKAEDSAANTDADGPKDQVKHGKIRAAACRKAGQQQGLVGLPLGDHVQVCVLEARLACLKQAIAEKAYGPQRKSFIESCLDKPS